MHLSMSSRCGGGGGIGRDFDRSLWPGVGHLSYLAVPEVGIFEFLIVPVTTNHFPGGAFWLYLTSHFCPGVENLTAIFWKMSKFRPMPRRLDIDRCIILRFFDQNVGLCCSCFFGRCGRPWLLRWVKQWRAVLPFRWNLNKIKLVC